MPVTAVINSTDALQSIHDIIARRDQSIAQLNVKADEIRDEMDKIDASVQAANGNYPKDQQNKWDDLYKLLVAILDAKKEVILISLSEIDDSQEVQGLIDTLNTVNDDLKKAFQSVQKVSQQIKNISEVVKKITALITGLTGLLPGK